MIYTKYRWHNVVTSAIQNACPKWWGLNFSSYRMFKKFKFVLYFVYIVLVDRFLTFYCQVLCWFISQAYKVTTNTNKKKLILKDWIHILKNKLNSPNFKTKEGHNISNSVSSILGFTQVYIMVSVKWQLGLGFLFLSVFFFVVRCWTKAWPFWPFTSNTRFFYKKNFIRTTRLKFTQKLWTS